MRLPNFWATFFERLFEIDQNPTVTLRRSKLADTAVTLHVQLFARNSQAFKFSGNRLSTPATQVTVQLGIARIAVGIAVNHQHSVKQLGSAGSGDPLDQRATVGWKATRAAELLVPQYVVRIETTATK